MKPAVQAIIRTSLLPALFALACGALHCTQQVAGGTSTTDNPKIVGVIVGDDNRPASNTRVMLMSEHFDPLRDTAELRIDTTDANGRFSLPPARAGVFSIQAIHLVRRTQLLITGIVVDEGDDSVTARDDTLKAPGALTVELPDSVDHTSGYVYIPGTTIFAPLDNSSRLTLDSVPAGLLPSVRYATENSFDSKVLRYDVRVRPGSTTEIAMPGWKHAAAIVLNTTATGAATETNVTNFPLCIRLDGSNFDFSEAFADGADVRFVKRDGTALTYETERWDAAAGQAVVWVKMDTVYKNDSLQRILMYWGNEQAAAPPRQAFVFDSADGAAAVLHFGGDARDASSAQNHANACSATDTTGIIGLCKKFSGNDSIVIPGLLGSPPSITLYAWVKQDTAMPLGSEVVSVGDAALMRLDYDNNGFGTGGAVHRSDTSAFNHLGSGRFLKNTGWHFVAFSFNGTSFMSNLYIDGVPSGSRNDPGIPIKYQGVGVNTCIGKHGNGKKEYNYLGYIDEVRIFRKVLSADFIKLCYMNQRIDDKLLVYEK